MNKRKKRQKNNSMTAGKKHYEAPRMTKEGNLRLIVSSSH